MRTTLSKRIILSFFIFLAYIILTVKHGYSLPAFPSAEGFGAETIGGRGGRVLTVTNLNNAGPGSLREALEASGPRTVVFQIAGTISLETGIEVTEPYLTIAGQTAPEGGITLKNARDNINNPLTI